MPNSFNSASWNEMAEIMLRGAMKEEGMDFDSLGLHRTGVDEAHAARAFIQPAYAKVLGAITVGNPVHTMGALLEFTAWVHVVAMFLGFDIEKHQDRYITAMLDTMDGKRKDEAAFISSQIRMMLAQDSLDKQEPGRN